MGNQERKLNLKSKDIISHNVELINQLFPHCITEQDGKKVVDFEKLKQEFSDDIVDEIKEKYELTWPGKREAIREARISTTKTLLPDMNKSVDFENTNNVYIEGDNLEVLKILQESYLNKIKCIYIDPPYNTGKDFIYNDNFSKVTEEELVESGQIDEEGNKFTQNLESNGRYHSDWLSMMYPRLKLARNLLKEDGVIFISIDDNEYDNLKKICDEIFGENNFVRELVWKKGNAQNDAENIQKNTESILVYLKKISKVISEEKEQKIKLYEDELGYYYLGSGLTTGGAGGTLNSRPNLGWSIYYNEITGKIKVLNDYDKEKAKVLNNELEVYSDNDKLLKAGYKIIRAPKKGQKLGCWTWSYEKISENLKNIHISENYVVRKKERLKRKESKIVKSFPMKNLLEYASSEGTKQCKVLFDDKYFDNPKNIKLISHLLNSVIKNKNGIVLDFFSGSSSTAHAVMDVNSKDDGKRKYIMVQLDEKINEESNEAAYNFCIDNKLETIIPSIAQERIKRAGAKIKEETGADIDYGFRVYKLSDSILNSNKILPKDMTQTSLDLQGSKYVEGTRKEDIVTSIILDLGLMLDSDIKLLDNDCYVIEENLLFICLSDSFDMGTLDKIKEIEPDQVVLSEDSFEDDSTLTNMIQEIKNINSDIEVKLI